MIQSWRKLISNFSSYVVHLLKYVAAGLSTLELWEMMNSY